MTTKEIEEKPKLLKKVEFSQTVANQFMKLANSEKMQKSQDRADLHGMVSHNYYIIKEQTKWSWISLKR